MAKSDRVKAPGGKYSTRPPNFEKPTLSVAYDGNSGMHKGFPAPPIDPPSRGWPEKRYREDRVRQAVQPISLLYAAVMWGIGPLGGNEGTHRAHVVRLKN